MFTGWRTVTLSNLVRIKSTTLEGVGDALFRPENWPQKLKKGGFAIYYMGVVLKVFWWPPIYVEELYGEWMIKR